MGYPAAPKDKKARRDWFAKRNAAIQGGPAPDLAKPRKPLPAFAKRIKKKNKD